MAEKFSLKDELFNPAKVQYLAGLISAAYPKFSAKQFVTAVVEKFPERELKARIEWIRDTLQKFLPDDFETAVQILIQSLPPELDPENSDDDYGDFIFAPFSDFVAQHGCTEHYLEFSLEVLERMTKNFSAEDSIRFFLRKFPEKTVQKMEDWSQSSNYHVRRLASEGARPKLPWSQKVELSSPEIIQKILENLYADPTRYVVRSVANHLNDIAKDDEHLVIETLKRWKNSDISRTKNNQKELEFLISHSLRTLIKKGNAEALELLGYSPYPEILVENFLVQTSEVKIGEYLEFSGEIVSHAKSPETSEKSQKLMIDYIIHFIDKSGKTRPKVFKLKKTEISGSENFSFSKRHPLRIMTTKKLYAGTHRVDVQINGRLFSGGSFGLVV